MDNPKNNPSEAPYEASSTARENFSFSFVMTSAAYRRMLYFNTFARQRGKSWFILFSWAVSVILLILERMAIIPAMDEVAHGCLMLVGVAFPALVLTMEFSIFQFRRKKPEEFSRCRTLAFSEEGIVLSGTDDSGKSGSMILEKWSTFPSIFETASLFILYKDSRQLTLLPKSAVPTEVLPGFRSLLKEKIGKGFISRV